MSKSYKLNNTYLPAKLYDRAMQIKRDGGKVFIVTGDDRTHQPAQHCDNCTGTGAVGIEWFVGGPYLETPPIQNNPPTPKSEVPPRLTSYKGKWYKNKVRTATCPVCSGTGAAVQEAPKPRKMDL